MRLYQICLMCCFVPSLFGAVIIDNNDSKDIRAASINSEDLYSDAQESNELVEEELMPLVSNTPIPEALSRNTLTLILLQIIRQIFRIGTQLGLAEQGWRLSSGFMNGLMSILFGPDVDIFIPVLTSIGTVVLRWLT